MARPIAIDLFAGAGGMSLGFEEAGFDIAVAVEIDPVHASVHSFNFPMCRTISKSVVGLSGVEILEVGNLKSGEVDIVFGGPPCQGFSLIGQRSLKDPRNSLVGEFVRLVGELSPKYFVFENVKGLTQGKQRAFLNELLEAFHQIGYNVKLPWKVLNASHYGVPQHRERLILIGAKKSESLPDYPEKVTSSPKTSELSLPKTPNCKDAIGDLPDVEEFLELYKQDWVRTEKWGETSEYAKKLRCLDDSDWGWSYRRIFDPLILSSSMRTKHSQISQSRFTQTQPGQVEPISRFLRLSPDGICNTLRAGTDSARGAFTSPRPIHYAFPRCVSVREMARLHGFPDWFRFHATKWHGARQIGNAVPPLLARAVASKLIEVMGFVPEKQIGKVKLGSEMLLSLDMKNASKYWGVAIPISGRDRKSGAKKRKQEEIEKSRVR